MRDVQEEHLEGFDAVVHLAALSNDPVGDLDEALTYAINHEATVRLAELARARGVERFVFASSCSMYGASGSTSPVDESAPLAPLTAYAESKVRSERSLAQLLTDDFSPVCLRFATAYGASPRLRLDIVLNNLVGWGLTTGAVRLQSDGTAWRPLIHVEDMARAIAAVLSAPRDRIHGQAFNAGAADANYLVRDLALLVRGIAAGRRGRIRRGGRRGSAQLPRRLLEDLGDARWVPAGMGRFAGCAATRRRIPCGRHGRGDVLRRPVRPTLPPEDATRRRPTRRQAAVEHAGRGCSGLSEGGSFT